MTIEQQVCSLELAKKLKDLGVKQESIWLWIKRKKKRKIEKKGEWGLSTSKEILPSETTESLEYLSAYTVAELGEMLPEGCRTWKYAEGWAGKIPGEQNTMGSYDTEANGRAKMLIYLIENKLITL